MSKIQSSTISEEKHYLAQFLTDLQIVNDLLFKEFMGCVKKIKEISKKQFSENQIWNLVSKDKLLALNEVYFFEFSLKVLSEFSNQEIDQMLKECLETGSINDDNLGSMITAIQAFENPSIHTLLSNKAKSMAKDLYSDITTILNIENFTS